MTPHVICADCTIRDRALCSTLNDQELVALTMIARRQRVGAGQTVSWAGDEAVICGNLISGICKLVAATADGREQIVGLLYPADFFGDPYEGRNDFTLVALTDAELCVFPRAAFERLLDRHPRMERLLLQRTFDLLNQARERMLVLARKSAEEKMAGFLLEIAARSRGSRADASSELSLTFDLPLTRGQIADVLGMTIETVSRQMTKMKASGVIALPGGRTVVINDYAALAARAEAG